MVGEICCFKFFFSTCIFLSLTVPIKIIIEFILRWSFPVQDNILFNAIKCQGVKLRSTYRTSLSSSFEDVTTLLKFLILRETVVSVLG